MRNLYVIGLVGLAALQMLSCNKETTPLLAPEETKNSRLVDSASGSYSCKVNLYSFLYATDTSKLPTEKDSTYYSTITISPDTAFNQIDFVANNYQYYGLPYDKTASTNKVIVFDAYFIVTEGTFVNFYPTNDSIYIVYNNYAHSGIGNSAIYSGKRVK